MVSICARSSPNLTWKVCSAGWMFFREPLSIREIQQRTSLSRNTIKKWLEAPDGAQPQFAEGEGRRQADGV